MEAYAQVLSYAIPGFVLLILIEELVGRMRGIRVNRAMDTISSLSSGMTNTLKSLIGLTIVIVSYDWMVSHIALVDIKSSAWLFVLAFIGHDFAGYWSHRFNHEINVFWNRHIVHHSSEEFNLSCALRQSISSVVSIYFFLYIPMALLGIPTLIVATVAPLHLFAQFWYHTRLIDKMGWLEYIIVTPSHHRVHHAINPEYIDKNYGQIFIFWDKWFGTFQPELPDVPAVYGTKKPANTWNPIIINYQHMWLLAKDAWRTSSLWDKVRLWFMPTGWRPKDVAEKYPIEIVEDVYKRPKYDTPAPMGLKAWSWAQLIIHNLLMYYIMTMIADIGVGDMVLFCSFLFVSIFAYTTLMDRHRLAIPFELIKLVMGFLMFTRMESWYMLDNYIPGASIVIGSYLLVSFLVACYYTFSQSPVTEKLSAQNTI
ncbi:MAG: sterol desaturase family protein [Bacteroidota bacterium]